MRLKLTFGLALGTLIILAVGIHLWMRGAPRRDALATLARLESALHAANRAELLDLVALPAAIQGRTAPEQSEFLIKALTDEISPAGLAALKHHGEYGPLKQLFPAEAETWIKLAGVNPDECVAFKLEHQGVRAEVVLVRDQKTEVSGQASYRIVRVNNVKQMADTNLPTTEKQP